MAFHMDGKYGVMYMIANILNLITTLCRQICRHR